MLYLLGKETGEFVRSTGAAAATVTAENDRLVIELSFGTPAPVDAKGLAKKGKNWKKPKKSKKSKKSQKVRGKDVISFEGKPISEWARELKVHDSTIRYRLKTSGTPFGKEKPSDKDRVLAR